MTPLADNPHLGLFIKAAIPGKDNGFDNQFGILDS
jgi:hypothetical protein